MVAEMKAEPSAGRLGFGIDRGGTFTDVVVVYPPDDESGPASGGSSNRIRTFKLLSEDPANYADAPTEAIRRALSEWTGAEVPRGTPIPTRNIAWIRMVGRGE